MAGYIGTAPVPQATQHRETFTATASQTSFATAGYTVGFLDVFLNGVKLVNGDDFTATNGSDVVLTTGAASGDIVEVISYSTFEVNSQTFTGTTTLTGDLQATTATFSGAVTGTDATLSGGVYLGGTGAANLLDDYEEGTWTPTFYDSSMGTSITYSNNTYIKVGNIVQLQAVITFAGTSGITVVADYFQLTGLPFQALNMGNGVWWQSTSYSTGLRNSGHCMIAANYIYGGCEYAGGVGRQVACSFSLTYETI